MVPSKVSTKSSPYLTPHPDIISSLFSQFSGLSKLQNKVHDDPLSLRPAQY